MSYTSLHLSTSPSLHHHLMGSRSHLTVSSFTIRHVGTAPLPCIPYNFSLWTLYMCLLRFLVLAYTASHIWKLTLNPLLRFPFLDLGIFAVKQINSQNLVETFIALPVRVVFCAGVVVTWFLIPAPGRASNS